MKLIKEITATTKFAAVIGQPLGHSLSPAIYNNSFVINNDNAVYLAFETSERLIVERINSLKSLGALGINITMPGKHEALKCVDRLDTVAAYVQAINTIVKQDNEWVGYNTDGEGYWLSVKNDGVTLENKRLTLFGSGGTSGVILARAVVEGISYIDVVGRNLERQLKIKTIIKKILFDYPNVLINLIDLNNEDELRASLWHADIVVQTSSVGMSPDIDHSIIANNEWFNPKSLVSDVIYEPSETKFLRDAKARGCKVVGGGIHMLIGQASLNYQLYTGKKFPFLEISKEIRDIR